MRWEKFKHNDIKYTVEVLRYLDGYEGYLYKEEKIVKDPRPPNFAMRYRAFTRTDILKYYMLFVDAGHATMVAD